jgi:hypothetical protein
VGRDADLHLDPDIVYPALRIVLRRYWSSVACV